MECDRGGSLPDCAKLCSRRWQFRLYRMQRGASSCAWEEIEEELRTPWSKALHPRMKLRALTPLRLQSPNPDPNMIPIMAG
ncbi:MAG: hypothetical protein JHD23_06180 [Akkermansiaceae bacterium]|nr:hypothetical protein [Akkermansiaceae bacterium]